MAYLALTIVLILISIVGVLLNGYILVVVLLTRQLVSANNILLLHLGLVDTLLGILFLAFSIPGFNNRNGWVSSGTPCTLHGFLFTLLHPLILWTICGLNCDRYYAIAAPLHYGHLVNSKKVLMGLGAGWILSLTLCVPPFFTVAPYTYIPGLGSCAPDFSIGPGALWYSAVYTAFTLLLPATLIICCNLKILMIARYHRHRIASAIYEVTLSAQVTITHQRNPFFVPTVTAPQSGGPKFRGRSAIYAVLQILGSFLVLYVPYYGAILWEASSSTLFSTAKVPFSRINPHIFSIASTLLTCSPPVNGFLYGVKNKTLRKTFQNYLRKKLTKNEVNQEIQARTPSTCGSRRPSLTPLGFFSKPTIQRRLSEAFLDVHRVVNSPHRPKIKRISSELTCRPHSTNGLNLSPTDDKAVKLPQALSCNTLQVPRADSDEVSVIGEEEIVIQQKRYMESPNTRTKVTNSLLYKFFGAEQSVSKNKKAAAVQNVLEGSPSRSPRILITRAFSEDSDKNHSHPVSPAKDAMNRTHSTSATTLIEKKWRQLTCTDDCKDEEYNETGIPLLDSTNSNRSSDSSDNSEGQICLTLDRKSVLDDGEIEIATEDQLLLSWEGQKKCQRGDSMRKKPPLLKQALVQSHEVVL